MTALLVVLMFAGFAALDVIVRLLGRRLEARRDRRQRERVLQSSLRLDFAAEAKSLKRVEVPGARARILAVDDETVVLDGFRKILVLAGYSVDTVESGPEALTLVQRGDYDFVFTDLKMPGMDGVEVVKAVRHLRPDVDVAVITGYGSIETAVETLQHGAADYVQKPFTEDELVAFVQKLYLKRQARLEAARRPLVRIGSPDIADAARPREYALVGGAFFAAGHTWARIEPSGRVRAGLDDFARRVLGPLDAVALPAIGQMVARGDVLFRVRHGDHSVGLPSPISGKVSAINAALVHRAHDLSDSPYERGWVCLIEPSDLVAELKSLRLGQAAMDWYYLEIERLRKAQAAGGTPDWDHLQAQFFAAPSAAPRPVPIA